MAICRARTLTLALQPGYERRMALESHCKQSELYRDLGIEDAADKAKWHSAQAEIMRKSGVQRLSIRDRFRAAELPRDFKLIYADLTAGAHSDYAALITKHVGHTGVRLGSPMTDYALVKSAWVSTALAHGGAVLLPHFADVDLTALQETLAPLKGIEDGIQGYREEALRRQRQGDDSAGQP